MFVELVTTLCLSQNGAMPLIAASQKGHTETLKALITANAQVNAQDKVSPTH